jgi:hypothetical protein
MSKFGELIDLDDITPINVGLTSPTEETMISLLGRPRDVDSTKCNNAKASDTVKRLQVLETVGPFRVTGIKPAVDSLREIFKDAKLQEPKIWDALGSEGMLCVRFRKPTSGRPSTKLSNHSWGTALDIKVDGVADGKRDRKVQRGIGILIPIFNRHGWFAGAGFTTAEDDMHFEVATETLQTWARIGLLGT